MIDTGSSTPPRRSRWRRWKIALTFIAILWAGIEIVNRIFSESAEHRVRRYFAVGEVLDTATLRAAVLRELPIGSPEALLADFVRSKRIGADGRSSYQAPGEDGGPSIRIDEDMAPLAIIFETYIIAFRYDSTCHLAAVKVMHAATGP